MFTLNFSIHGNPDHGESDWTESHTITADTIENMRAKVSKFQGDNGIGGGNWGEAVLLRNSEFFGYMSYNGRVWKEKYWTLDSVGTEVIFSENPPPNGSSFITDANKGE